MQNDSSVWHTTES